MEEEFYETNVDIQSGTVEAAIAFAVSSHGNQKCKVGRPYILHPLRVMFAVDGDDVAMQAAVLHDVCEDCGVTFDQLREAGFSDEVVEIVDLLTRPPEGAENRPTHRQYVERIRDSKNVRAIKVKRADSLDNLARVNDLPPDKRSLAKRYEQALEILLPVL